MSIDTKQFNRASTNPRGQFQPGDMPGWKIHMPCQIMKKTPELQHTR